MSEENSLLDKIISSQQVSELEEFNPAEIVSNLLKYLSNKEQDVLRRRFGLNGQGKETLEKIGQIYNVTRERIRQIERLALKKTRELKNFSELIKPIEKVVGSFLEQHGGIMSERNLLQDIFKNTPSNQDIGRASLLFAISELLTYKFLLLGSDSNLRKSWKLKSAPEGFAFEVIKVLTDIIKKQNKPLKAKEIFENLQKTDIYQKNQSRLTLPIILSYLDISREIDVNPFSEYGLSSWGTIIPKRMNDKIYLILKNHGQPMHFTEIAERINKIHFDKRVAFPPTIHNELILNSRYVLVGRGIYALREWGYEPGVVAEVLIKILKTSSKPMKREDLVREVLKQRVVKKNTVHLALTDKKKFNKLETGEYILVSPQ